MTQSVWVTDPAEDRERPIVWCARCLDSQDVSKRRYGYAIAGFIEDTSGEAVLVEEGSLYPARYRLERSGWVEGEWGTSELGRRAKMYALTVADRKQLAAESATWKRLSAAASEILLSPRRARVV